MSSKYTIQTIADTHNRDVLDVLQAAATLGILHNTQEIKPEGLETLLKSLHVLSPKRVQRIVDKARDRDEPAFSVACALAKQYESPITGQRWDAARIPQAPAALEIINEYGSWRAFWSSVDKTCATDNETDDPWLRRVLVLHDQGTSPAAISSQLRLSEKATDYYLKSLGILSQAFIQEHVPSLHALRTQQILNCTLWDRPGKNQANERMLEAIVEHLSDPRNLSYIGLPAANFRDVLLVQGSEYGITVQADKSLAAEHDPMIARVQRSLVQHTGSIAEGAVLKGFHLYAGKLTDALKAHPHIAANWVYLDYLSSWTREKQTDLNLLFNQRNIADEAVLFITLNDSLRERGRIQSGRSGLEDIDLSAVDQVNIVGQEMRALAGEYGHSIKPILGHNGKGITYEDTDRMILLGYKIVRNTALDILIYDALVARSLLSKQPKSMVEVEYRRESIMFGYRVRIENGHQYEIMQGGFGKHYGYESKSLLMQTLDKNLDRLRAKGIAVELKFLEGITRYNVVGGNVELNHHEAVKTVLEQDRRP